MDSSDAEELRPAEQPVEVPEPRPSPDAEHPVQVYSEAYVLLRGLADGAALRADALIRRARELHPNQHRSG